MQTVLFHLPGSCKYPDFVAFHLFQTSETDECHLRQLLSHTHSNTFTHTHWVKPTQEAPYTPALFWLRRQKGGSMPKKGERGGGTFRVGSQSAPGSTQTFFRVTHGRDSIDARAGGACVLNINQQRQRRSRGDITGEKMLKIAVVWRCRRFATGNVDITDGYNGEVCYHLTDQETPVCFFHKICFLFSQNS